MRQPLSLDGFGGGGFRVSGVWRPGSLLIVADVPHEWRPARIDDVSPDDLAEVLAAGPTVSEFSLLGSGAEPARPSKSVREAVQASGLGLEFMSTEAAARTHNVLAAQGRRFATALIAV